MGHYVYKYVDCNGEILYIGKNDTNLVSRLKQHKRDQLKDIVRYCDIYYIEVGSGYMSGALETMLINKYKPRYNKVKTQECEGIDFVEPEWKLYEKSEISKNIERLIDELKISVRWNIIETRAITKEEKEKLVYNDYEFTYDGCIPDNGEEVFVMLHDGNVERAVFYDDDVFGRYFEGYHDEGEVRAWMQFPTGYSVIDGRKMTVDEQLEYIYGRKSRVTIDGAVASLRSDFVVCQDDRFRIADWLEELKSLKNEIVFKYNSLNKAFNRGYNKAIDDYHSMLEERILNGKMVDDKFAYLDNCDIDEIAEQLKENK